MGDSYSNCLRLALGTIRLYCRTTMADIPDIAILPLDYFLLNIIQPGMKKRWGQTPPPLASYKDVSFYQLGLLSPFSFRHIIYNTFQLKAPTHQIRFAWKWRRWIRAYFGPCGFGQKKIFFYNFPASPVKFFLQTFEVLFQPILTGYQSSVHLEDR